MNTPIVKVIVESMRHEIAHAMSVHNDAINKSISDELKRAVDNFDFEAEIRAAASAQIAEMCQEVIRDTLQGIRYDMAFKARVRNLVINSLNKSVE